MSRAQMTLFSDRQATESKAPTDRLSSERVLEEADTDAGRLRVVLIERPTGDLLDIRLWRVQGDDLARTPEGITIPVTAKSVSAIGRAVQSLWFRLFALNEVAEALSSDPVGT